MNLEKAAPWLLVGYLLVKGQKKAAATTTKRNGNGARNGRQAAAPAKPTVAYLYQLPADGFDTTRVAFALPGQRPREMGIFGSPAKALEVVRSKRWQLAWEGVRQLARTPQGVK